MRLEKGIAEAASWFGNKKGLLRVEVPEWGYIGLGYAIGKGWVTYRGGNDFDMTEAGAKALNERTEPKAVSP